MKKHDLDHLTKTVTKCERCEYATACTRLRPCSEYAPALNSNFDVELLMDSAAKENIALQFAA